MKTTAKLIVTLPLLAAMALGTAGCETAGEHKVATGAGIGAATGALAGGIIGHQSGNRNAGIAIGAATGALIGAGTGYWLDQRAKKFEQVQDQNTQVQQVPAYTPPPAVAGQPAPPPVPEHITLRLNDTMLFTVGRSDISNEGAAKLDQIIALLNENPNETVIIRGFASSEGQDAANQVLSNNRAQNVRNYLVGHNVANPGRITAVGMGTSNPIASNDTEAGRAQNRRVEIEVYPPAGQQ
jgi:outer membrane protein OmpA-like peptidoglycan-associated protein